MGHTSLLVFDLETIPDTDAAPSLTGFHDAEPLARRKSLENYHLVHSKSDFVKHPFQRIVAIGYLQAEIIKYDHSERFVLKRLTCNREEFRSERDILEGFLAHLQEHKPRLVSYNGRNFDLPVIRYRAMLHQLPAPGLNPYRGSRYQSDSHCDLLEVLTDFNSRNSIKLHEICCALGLPGKVTADGTMVAEMYEAGRLTDIRNYCEIDVLNTYLLYLRHTLACGGIGREHYHQAMRDALDYLIREQTARPHLGQFLRAWEEVCAERPWLLPARRAEA